MQLLLGQGSRAVPNGTMSCAKCRTIVIFGEFYEIIKMVTERHAVGVIWLYWMGYGAALSPAMGTDTGPSGGMIWFGYADPDIEGPEKTYRKRWFRARKIGKEKPRRLVGYDVSASQTQIVATFMGIEAKMTMASSTQIAFKEELARWAYEAHCVTQRNKAKSFRAI